MKVIIVLCLLGLALAAPPPVLYPSDGKNAELLRYENDNTGFGGYRYAFEQSDGTKQEQEGEVVNEGREDEHLVVKGRYAYIGQDGVVYVVTYVADDKGFQPEIEQGPGGGVPPEVLNSLLGG